MEQEQVWPGISGRVDNGIQIWGGWGRKDGSNDGNHTWFSNLSIGRLPLSHNLWLYYAESSTPISSIHVNVLFVANFSTETGCCQFQEKMLRLIINLAPKDVAGSPEVKQKSDIAVDEKLPHHCTANR